MDSVELDNNNINNSILVLRVTTTTMISNLLNPLKLLRNARGTPRDWQGLAELCGISGTLLPSISRDKDPTSKILKLWRDQSKTDATVAKLVNYLEELDRYDVVDDILPLIEDDLKFHKENPPRSQAVIPHLERTDLLTRDDVSRQNQGLEPQLYDALVLFADDDIAFATQLIKTMEDDYDLKFCVKERDLLLGHVEHEATIKLITDRCGRLVVIISDEFLQSSTNQFFYRLAQSISLEQRSRKIIPCIYKECTQIPPELNCYTKLDFRRSNWNSYEKLRDSIKTAEKPRAKLSLPENSLFRGVDISTESNTLIRNPVSRSASNSEQFLSPAGLKPSLHKDTSSPRTISQSVKFSQSMNDLPNTEMPEDKIVPSTSTNGIGKYEEKTIKKSSSFLQKLKSWVPKSKAEKNRSLDQKHSDESDESNKETAIENMNRTADGSQNGEKHIKQEKKKRTIKLLLRSKKKQAVLANT